MTRKNKVENLYLPLDNGESLPLRLLREKRRSIKITVLPHGEVAVSAPRSSSPAAVLDFAKTKESWILRQLDRLSREFLLAPFEAEEEHRRRRALRREAEYFYQELIPPQWPYRPAALQIRAQKSRWGSCSSSGTISLNVYLTALPEELRHYVFWHELCHLKHPHHQKAFWQELEMLCPGSLKLRRELRRYHLPL